MNPALDAKGWTLRAPRRVVKEHRDGWLLRTGRSDGMTVVITGFVEPDCVYDLRLRLLVYAAAKKGADAAARALQ
ncbi:hypothetical protein [Burkholderia ubonensis]|uniref:hypothetical protein n=1 Tax=Burkholderia ubonensis TaxID=101571 RepID=UPI0012F9412F|nr:hypothetical protein [Burkholderia ubonensis]